MKACHIYKAFLLLVLILFSPMSFAWTRSVDFGYGISHDPNHTQYNNSGFLLTGDLFPVYQTPKMNWTVNGALGRWYTTAPQNKYLTTAAVSIALRYYPFLSYDFIYPPYLLGSWGPALLSNRHFGENTQAKRVTFQWNLGLGMEFNQVDVNFRLAHFSNAYLAKPDQGFTVLYLLSLGYLFL